MLSLYRALTTIAAPAISLYLNRRKANDKEDLARFHERLGRPEKIRPEGKLVWVHCASVGESISLLPLIERLLLDHSGFQVMVTSGTLTSAKLLGERLPARAFHQYIPVDRLPYVRQFLDHWRPDMALWAESEFWPNILSEAATRNVPIILINGRISSRSFKGWNRFPGLIKEILSCFILCFGQTDGDADRLKSLGARTVKSVGNLKAAAPPLPVDEQSLAKLQDLITDRPIFLAASTHPGEEEILLRVHRQLQKETPTLLTIIVPRHPGRGPEIAADLRKSGIKVRLRSADEPLTADCQIYIADTMGELGLFFRLAGIVFMGKSLVPFGGQNPLEAARLDCAVIYGTHMANFAEISDKMLQAGAALQVAGEQGLITATQELLNNKIERDKIALQGQKFASSEADVLNLVCENLDPYFKEMLK